MFKPFRFGYLNILLDLSPLPALPFFWLISPLQLFLLIFINSQGIHLTSLYKYRVHICYCLFNLVFFVVVYEFFYFLRGIVNFLKYFNIYEIMFFVMHFISRVYYRHFFVLYFDQCVWHSFKIWIYHICSFIRQIYIVIVLSLKKTYCKNSVFLFKVFLKFLKTFVYSGFLHSLNTHSIL